MAADFQAGLTQNLLPVFFASDIGPREQRALLFLARQKGEFLIQRVRFVDQVARKAEQTLGA